MMVVTHVPVLFILGQRCSNEDWWVHEYRTSVREIFPAAELFFPPSIPDQNNELMWHSKVVRKHVKGIQSHITKIKSVTGKT